MSPVNGSPKLPRRRRISRLGGCLHAFCARAKLAPNSIGARGQSLAPREVAGETFIRAHGVRSLPVGVGLLLALIFSGVLSCGGGEEEAPGTPSAPPAATNPPA